MNYVAGRNATQYLLYLYTIREYYISFLCYYGTSHLDEN